MLSLLPIYLFLIHLHQKLYKHGQNVHYLLSYLYDFFTSSWPIISENSYIYSSIYILMKLSTSTTNIVAPPTSTSMGYGTYTQRAPATGDGVVTTCFLILQISSIKFIALFSLSSSTPIIKIGITRF